LDHVPEAAVAPRRLAVRQNYPDPFNPATHNDFELPGPARTRLAVYDVRGRLVARLVDRTVEAGTHRVLWDGPGQDFKRLA
jgi:hypothetical protein